MSIYIGTSEQTSYLSTKRLSRTPGKAQYKKIIPALNLFSKTPQIVLLNAEVLYLLRNFSKLLRVFRDFTQYNLGVYSVYFSKIEFIPIGLGTVEKIKNICL